MARTVSKKTPTPSVFELACEVQEIEAKQLEGLDRLQTLGRSGLRTRKVYDQTNSNRLVGGQRFSTPHAATKTSKLS